MTTPLLHYLNHADRWLGRLEAFCLKSGILLMALNTITNVFGRYVFSQSLYFSEELNQILMVIVTFMGLGYVTRKGRHIRMSAIYDVMGDRHKKWVMLAITLSTALTLFLLSYYAGAYVAKLAPSLPKDHLMAVCLSGRGDKDMQMIAERLPAHESNSRRV